MAEPKTVQETLSKFNKYVKSQARANLTRGRSNDTRGLYDSISETVTEENGSWFARIYMEEYGSYQDQGVKGSEIALKAPNSPFRFGTGTGGGIGLYAAIKIWVRNKRFQFQKRDYTDKNGKTHKANGKGRFISYDQTAYLIAGIIYRTGLKPKRFLSKPFEKAYEKLPDELAEKYGLEVENILRESLK